MKRLLLLLLLVFLSPTMAQEAGLKKAMARELPGYSTWNLRTSGNWALCGWSAQEAEGMALFHRYPGGWELAQSGGGAMGPAELAILGVPASDRSRLMPDVPPSEQTRATEVLKKPYWTWLTDKPDMSDGDLETYTAWELTLMRNEIFARHGRPFSNTELRAYFLERPWYSPDSGFSESRLTPVQRANVSRIADYQKRSGKL